MDSKLPKEQNWAARVIIITFVALFVFIVGVIAFAGYLFKTGTSYEKSLIETIVKKEYKQYIKQKYEYKNDKERDLVSRYRSAEEPGGALTYINEAININPSSENYYLLGLVYVELNEKQKAKDAFETSLQKNKNNTETLALYGYLLASEQGFDEYEKGKELLQKAIDEDPSYAQAYYYYALILSERGEYVLAKEAIDQAIALSPESSEYKYVKEDLDFIVRKK